VKLRGIWNFFHPTLKRLLVSDIGHPNWKDADIFTILLCQQLTRIASRSMGSRSVQLATAILIYIPSARSLTGSDANVSSSPRSYLRVVSVAVVLARSFLSLVGVCHRGPAEIGEPCQAMIVDSARAANRARTVGLYYLVRSLSVTQLGDRRFLLWESAADSFFAAGLVGSRNADLCSHSE